MKNIKICPICGTTDKKKLRSNQGTTACSCGYIHKYITQEVSNGDNPKSVFD